MLGKLDITINVFNKLEAAFTQVTYYTHSNKNQAQRGVFELVMSSVLMYKICRLLLSVTSVKWRQALNLSKSYFCKMDKA